MAINYRLHGLAQRLNVQDTAQVHKERLVVAARCFIAHSRKHPGLLLRFTQRHFLYSAKSRVYDRLNRRSQECHGGPNLVGGRAVSVSQKLRVRTSVKGKPGNPMACAGWAVAVLIPQVVQQMQPSQYSIGIYAKIYQTGNLIDSD